MVPSSNSPKGAPHPETRRRILVAEDELLIRMMLSDELRDAGYDVIEAFNAEEAVALLKSLVRVDLIISDVRMPGSLDGFGLLSVVRDMFPGLPVIITSGHHRPTLGAGDEATQFVPKPYSLEHVVKLVKAKLGKAP